MLKSTPPTRAGTYKIDEGKQIDLLKSTPPTRAGTKLHHAIDKKILA